MKVLISDKLSEKGLAVFREFPQITVDYRPGLGKDILALKDALKEADAIAIRSETKLTAEILKDAPKLKVIGRAGIGVDNVDLNEASKRGIIVMNTPFGNTVTTAEHAISMICAASRQIPQATASIKAGKWEKSKFMGAELYQKKLGVIGCGNIGKIVADRAQGLKMDVIVYDPFLSDEAAAQMGVTKVKELPELLAQADFITLHVPKTDKTANMINKDAFARMKKGVYLINCARGGLVNEKDLIDAIKAGIVAGAALDVFDKEPVDPEHPLLKMDQVIFTPHLGASTEEAQENVAIDVSKQIADYLVKGTVANALNMPAVSGEVLPLLKPYLDLALKIGRLHGQLASDAPLEVNIEFAGVAFTDLPTAPMKLAVLHGILESIVGTELVNDVNAPFIAKERGIKVKESKLTDHEDFTSLLTVSVVSKSNTRLIAGTIFGKNHPRIVQLDDYYLEVVPEGPILVIHNHDQPGVVGKVGTLLSKNQLNISRLHLGLNARIGQAMSFYSLERNPTAAVLAELRAIEGVISVRQVVL